jgi:hypothetical protein
MCPSTPVFWPFTVPASGQKMRCVRRYSRSSSVMFSRGARLWPPQKCLSPLPVRMAQRIERSSHRSIHASEIASDVGLVEKVCLGGVVQRDVGDTVALFVVDGQAIVLRSLQGPL